MKQKLFTSMGLMSGTSMDGVDISIIQSDGHFELINILDRYFQYDNEIQEELIILRNVILNQEDLMKYVKEVDIIEKKITLFHADKIKKILSKYKGEIDLIGFHGQTIFHNPKKKFTKQLGDGNLLSQLLKKKVIYNFRNKDIENNGQGAPLTPIFHFLLSKNINKKYNIQFPIGIVNIGGITNLTNIIKNSDKIEDNISAYDIGPGNCMIDEWVRKNSNKKFDENGKGARLGKVDQLILNQAIENFSVEDYKKSLDIKDFDLSFVRGLSFEDGLSTITNFTGYLIAKGIEYLNYKNKNVKFLISGGGRKNKFLIECIKNNIIDKKNIILENVEKYNLDGDYIESQAFGYLAIRSFLKLPISFPKTTRCDSPVVGGILAKNY